MRYLLIVLGIVSLALGVIGIVVPLLPTTPFLLLSTILFARSSAKLHRWLLYHPVLGKYIQGFLEDKSIPMKVKILSISILWAVMLLNVFTFASGKWWLQTLLCAIAAGVTAHILSYKTRR